MSRPSLLHKCQVTHTPQVRSQDTGFGSEGQAMTQLALTSPETLEKRRISLGLFLPSAVEEVARKKRNRENENREGEQEAAINVGREEGHSRF